MGTLGETEEKKINNEIQKMAETMSTFFLTSRSSIQVKTEGAKWRI